MGAYIKDIYQLMMCSSIIDLHEKGTENTGFLVPKGSGQWSWYQHLAGRETIFPNAEDVPLRVLKCHSEKLIPPETDLIIVPFRRPTDILCSHVQFQYLGVSDLSHSLTEHSAFVYDDQSTYMNSLLTLRSCLETQQDSYLEVLLNALATDVPVFLIDYANFVSCPRAPTLVLLNRLGLRSELGDGYESLISKSSFIAAQEVILTKAIEHFGDEWHGPRLLGSGLLFMSRWAYDNGFRVVSNHPELSRLLRTLGPLTAPDKIYSRISVLVPRTGLMLERKNDKQQMIESILNVISSAREDVG
jgi:hypothetical protein